MPEIYEVLFEFEYLLKLLPQKDEETEIQFVLYEEKANEEMTLNRFKLFGYQKELEAAY